MTPDTIDGDTPAGDTGGKDEATPPVGTGTLCHPCTKDDECGDGRCTQLAEGSFCTAECATNDDCPSGYQCFQVTSEGKDCVPGLYTKCPQCLIDGCPAGQTCDQVAGTCKAAAGECGPCEKDDDCGLGLRCFAFSPEVQRCVPECGDGCPGNSACDALAAGEGTQGVRVCKPQGGACCFGDDCAGGCDCSDNPAKPYCNPAGDCVQCLTDANCPQDKPDCQAGTCAAGASCPAATPVPCSSPSGCCECTNDSHCSGAKPYCQANGTCGAEQSCACVPPYPACLNVEGQVVCVECVSDGDCPTAGCTCNAADHTCVGADGAACAGSGTIPAAECTGCTTDGDCAAAEGFSLKCDAGTGCCYDTAGKCDNVAAFCPSGSACTGLMAIAGVDLGALLGGGTGIPGMPGGGGLPTDALGNMASYCSCPPACLGGVTCVSGKDISDKALGMLAGFLGGMVNPSTSTFCADLNSVPGLLDGILGGGGLPFP